MNFIYFMTISALLIMHGYTSNGLKEIGGHCIPIESVSKLSDNELQYFTEVSIPLEKSYNIGKNKELSGAIKRLVNMNPQVTIVLDCGHETQIGDNCLYVGLFSPFFCPITKVRVNGRNVESIGKQFLGLCTNLVCADLSSLTNVKTVDDCFLSRDSKLTDLALPNVASLQEVGDAFLFGCSQLNYVKLKWLSTVNKIGNSFFWGNKALAFIDLSPLKKEITVGENFLLLHEGMTHHHETDFYTIIISEGNPSNIPIPSGYRIAYLKST